MINIVTRTLLQYTPGLVMWFVKNPTGNKLRMPAVDFNGRDVGRPYAGRPKRFVVVR